MEYTSRALIEAYLKRSITEYEDSFLAVAVPAVEKWIDKYLNSHFGDVEPSTKRFDGHGHSTLDIQPCKDITVVGVLDSQGTNQYNYVTETEYIAYPLNETVKNELVRKLGYFPCGVANITITATFTEYDGEVPPDIQIATTRLVAGLIAGSAVDANGVAIKAESIEGHSITYDASPSSIEQLTYSDPAVKAILSSRRTIKI